MKITPFKLFILSILYGLLFSACGSNLGLAAFLGASSGMGATDDGVTGGSTGANYAEDDDDLSDETDATDESATYYIDADGNVTDMSPTEDEGYYEDLEEFADAYASSFAETTDDNSEYDDSVGADTGIPVASTEEYGLDEGSGSTGDVSGSVSGGSATDAGNDEEPEDPAEAVAEELSGEETGTDAGQDDGTGATTTPDEGSGDAGSNEADSTTDNSATDDAWENGTHLKDEFVDIPIAGTLPAKNDEETEEGEESTSEESTCSAENSEARMMVMNTNDDESLAMMMKSMPGRGLMRKGKLGGLETVARGILHGGADDDMELTKVLLKDQTLFFPNQDDLWAADVGDEELEGLATTCEKLPDDIDTGLDPKGKSPAGFGSVDGGLDTDGAGAVERYSWQAIPESVGAMELVFGKAILDASGITVIPNKVKDIDGDSGASVKFSPSDFGLSGHNATDYQINTVPFIIMRPKIATSVTTQKISDSEAAIKPLNKTTTFKGSK